MEAFLKIPLYHINSDKHPATVPNKNKDQNRTKNQVVATNVS